MKTSNATPLESKNYRSSMLVCLLLLAVKSSVFAQNNLAILSSSKYVGFIIAIVCVIGLALFLISAFMKQKKQ